MVGIRKLAVAVIKCAIEDFKSGPTSPHFKSAKRFLFSEDILLWAKIANINKKNVLTWVKENGRL